MLVGLEKEHDGEGVLSIAADVGSSLIYREKKDL